MAQFLHATVLVGVEQDVGVSHYLNEVVAWAPDGQIVDTYVKNHLVPFGTPAGPIGVMISYEVFFDGRARGAVRAGGQILVVPTNTASYRSTEVPTQELAAARLRAWETGRWVLQVTPTGYTAVIDPTGRVLQRTALDEQQVLTATVPREDGRTVYVNIGDAPIAIAAALLVGLAWLLAPAGIRRTRRGPKPSS